MIRVSCLRHFLCLFGSIGISAAGHLWAEASPSDNPFTLSLGFDSASDPPILRIRWEVPPGHYLYANAVSVEATPPLSLVLATRPDPEIRFDEVLQENLEVFSQPLEIVYKLLGWDRQNLVRVRIQWQGCRGAVCFLPQEETWVFDAAGRAERFIVREEDEEAEEGKDSFWQEVRRSEGYLNAEDFLRFLEGKRPASVPFLDRAFAAGGFAALLVSFIGGILLNLTPCVLPLVPVILAILGGGHRIRSRRQGLGRGLIYGLGIAAAYGFLGVFVVRTGAFFGAWMASPWVNGFMAVLFFALAMALFGVFTIDLSRFQPTAILGQRGSSRWVRWEGATVFGMGALSALLAGACVAPVVVAVLAHSALLSSRQPALAFLLPFALGIGMGLPWPLAGAGLTILPKPGRWMIGINILFGFAVMFLSVQYAHTAWEGFRYATQGGERRQVETLARGIAKAERDGRPILLDFWATWCKSCMAMERTTFRDERVRAALERYVRIKIQAERPTDPDMRRILDRYSVTGLPTFIVLDRFGSLPPP